MDTTYEEQAETRAVQPTSRLSLRGNRWRNGVARRQMKRFELAPQVASGLFGQLWHQPVSAESKVSAPFRGEIRLTNGQLAATLDDIQAGVARLTSPNTGQVNYMMSLNYLVTSHGHEAHYHGAPGYGFWPYQVVIFRGPGGIILHQWQVGSFSLVCGWHRRSQSFFRSEAPQGDWFYLWNGYTTHYVGGRFRRCG